MGLYLLLASGFAASWFAFKNTERDYNERNLEFMRRIKFGIRFATTVEEHEYIMMLQHRRLEIVCFIACLVVSGAMLAFLAVRDLMAYLP